jgi:c(7)-type cytochrome triheme protein
VSYGRSTHTSRIRAPLAGIGIALLGALLLWASPSVGVPDVVQIPRGEPTPGAPAQPATFSHWEHGRFRCFSCHPGLFSQARAAFTHADMNQGRFCGACHDGRTARAPSAYRCEICHASR